MAAPLTLSSNSVAPFPRGFVAFASFHHAVFKRGPRCVITWYTWGLSLVLPCCFRARCCVSYPTPCSFVAHRHADNHCTFIRRTHPCRVSCAALLGGGVLVMEIMVVRPQVVPLQRGVHKEVSPGSDFVCRIPQEFGTTCLCWLTWASVMGALSRWLVRWTALENLWSVEWLFGIHQMRNRSYSRSVCPYLSTRYSPRFGLF